MVMPVYELFSAVAPEAEHILDWFHISMKFQNLKQLAKGINGLTEGAIRSHALVVCQPSTVG